MLIIDAFNVLHAAPQLPWRGPEKTHRLTLQTLARLIAQGPTADELQRATMAYVSTQIRALESVGVSSFESVGQPLDPAFHEAVAQVPGAEGAVVVEFEKGYKLREKVIRHAKVTVGNGAEA